MQEPFPAIRFATNRSTTICSSVKNFRFDVITTTGHFNIALFVMPVESAMGAHKGDLPEAHIVDPYGLARPILAAICCVKDYPRRQVGE